MKPIVKRSLKWLAVAVLAVLVIGAAGFVWWGTHPLGPGPDALAALQTDASVRVARARDGWEFAPVSVEPTTGYIFYPGGHVDARSYAAYARDVAARVYLVVIPVMPLSLAVLDINAGDKVIAAHPRIERWVIGGHSLGGVMAAQYASSHQRSIRGLVMLAAYPPQGADLSASDIRVLSLVGTLDRGMDRTALQAARAQLPGSARYVDLPGANHAQFGDYGAQPGDDPNPTMSAVEQLARAVDGTVDVLSGR